MQNYQTGSPVDYHNAIAATGDNSGNLLFFSIGSDGHVYSFTSADDTPTGWQRTDLSQGMDDFTAVLLAAEQDENGAPLLAAVMQSKSTHEYSVFFTKDFAAATGNGRWVFRGKGDAQVTDIAAGHGKDGSVLIVITTQQGVQATNFLVNPDLNEHDQSKLWRKVPSPVNPRRVISTAIGHNSRLEAIDEVQGLLYSLYQTSEGETMVVVTSLPDFTFYNHRIPLDFNPTAFGATRGAQDDTELIVGDTKLYHLSPQIQMARDAGQVKQGLDPVTTQPTTHNIKTIEAGAMQDGLLEAWFLTEDGSLSRTYQGSDQQWVSPLPFQAQVGEMVAWRSEDKSLLEVFTADLENRLKRYRQDPKTTLWKSFDILVESLNTHHEIQTYVTQLHITDQYGAPAANQNVTIRASELTPLKINGSVYYAEPDSGGVVCQTDMLGNLSIENKVEGLSTPTLRLQADVLGNQLIDVDPAAEVHHKLSTLTLDQLKNAKMQTDTIDHTEPMLPGKTDKDLGGAHQALQELTDMNSHPPSQNVFRSAEDQPIQFVARGAGTPMLNRVAYGALPSGYRWGLDFTGQHPVFTTDQSEIEQVHLAKLDPQTRASVLSARSVLDNVEHFFGDVWHAIENGLIEVEHWAVQKVSDGIQFIIHTAKKTYTVVVKFAEQVWSVIEYVFKQIGAFFEKIVRWLGFIFNWKDILVTHDVFVDAANSMFQLSETEVSVLEDKVNEWCDNIEQEVRSLQPFPSHIGDASAKESANSALAGVKSGAAGTSFAKLPAFISSDPAANWGNNQLQHTNMISGIQGSTASPGDHQLTQAVTRFVDETMTAEITKIEALIEQLADDLKRAYDNNTLSPNQIMAQLSGDVLEGVIEVFRRLLLGLLELVKDLLEWAKGLINKPIHIPLLTHFYENTLAPGRKLSLLDGMSLLAAIPVTIIYKLFIGKAPFKKGDRAPLPPVSLHAAGGKPHLTEAEARPRESRLANAANMAKDAPTGSSQKPPDHVKNWTYTSGFLLSILGYIGAAIDGIEYWKISKVEGEAEREAKRLGKSLDKSVSKELGTLKENVRTVRAIVRILTVMCLLPLEYLLGSESEDETYPYQWGVFGATAFGFIKDFVLLCVDVDNENADTAGNVCDALIDLGTLGLETAILIIEVQNSKDEHSEADKVMKYIEYILSNVGGLLLDGLAFTTEPNIYVFVVGEGCVLRGADLNTCRVGLNIHHDSVHDNA
jgi:hypothetical protein